jgi:nucleotide-binding universal stress UspA family protein
LHQGGEALRAAREFPTSNAEPNMIRDIIVNLTPRADFDPACAYAISLAETFNANITGVSFAYDPPWPPSVLEAAVVDIYRTVKDNYKKDAQQALSRFEDAARRSQLSAQALLLETSLVGSVETFTRLARTYDLSVVKQPEPDRDDTAQDMLEAALFETGRPTLIVPYIQKEGFSAKRVLCCWDGSRAAARAMGDALPILQKAGSVKVLTIATGKFDERDVKGADLATHLARHKLQVELVRIPAADIDVASAILSHAADSSATLIVMGGYGHSKMRELALGGATRGMLESMTVPTLMSH